MTPPDVLLKKATKQAKQLLKQLPRVSNNQSCTQGVGVASSEEGVATVVDVCIRCVALARIVYGDDHWVLAKMHIQLGHVYLQLRCMYDRLGSLLVQVFPL